ncbi:MAG: hypothetical protein RhofKO_10680 [Rhodothermales bacterium]
MTIKDLGAMPRNGQPHKVHIYREFVDGTSYAGRPEKQAVDDVILMLAHNWHSLKARYAANILEFVDHYLDLEAKYQEGRATDDERVQYNICRYVKYQWHVYSVKQKKKQKRWRWLKEYKLGDDEVSQHPAFEARAIGHGRDNIQLARRMWNPFYYTPHLLMRHTAKPAPTDPTVLQSARAKYTPTQIREVAEQLTSADPGLTEDLHARLTALEQVAQEDIRKSEVEAKRHPEGHKKQKAALNRKVVIESIPGRLLELIEALTTGELRNRYRLRPTPRFKYPEALKRDIQAVLYAHHREYVSLHLIQRNLKNAWFEMPVEFL